MSAHNLNIGIVRDAILGRLICCLFKQNCYLNFLEKIIKYFMLSSYTPYRLVSIAALTFLQVSCASNSQIPSSKSVFFDSSRLFVGEAVVRFSLVSNDQKAIDCVEAAIIKVVREAEYQQVSIDGKRVKQTISFSKNVTLPNAEYEMLFTTLEQCVAGTSSEASLKINLTR